MVFLEKTTKKEKLFSYLDRIPEAHSREVWLKTGDDTYVSSAEIMYIRSANKYVEIYTRNQKKVAYYSIKECIKRLPSDGFRRVQKSYLINFAYVKKIGTETLMADGFVIHPTRGTIRELKRAYMVYCSERAKRYL